MRRICLTAMLTACVRTSVVVHILRGVSLTSLALGLNSGANQATLCRMSTGTDSTTLTDRDLWRLVQQDDQAAFAAVHG